MDVLGPRVELHDVDAPGTAVLFDAQTSGGMLIAIASDRASVLVDRLASQGARGWIVGSVAAGRGRIEVRR